MGRSFACFEKTKRLWADLAVEVHAPSSRVPVGFCNEADSKGHPRHTALSEGELRRLSPPSFKSS